MNQAGVVQNSKRCGPASGGPSVQTGHGTGCPLLQIIAGVSPGFCSAVW